MPTALLQQARLADGQLDGVGTRGDEGVDRRRQVLDALQERLLAEEAVVDRDVEAAAGRGVEQAAQAVAHVGHGVPFAQVGCEGESAPIACVRH